MTPPAARPQAQGRLVEDDETPRLACPVCGAAREPGDPVLCAVCGEPVLEGGWAP